MLGADAAPGCRGEAEIAVLDIGARPIAREAVIGPFDQVELRLRGAQRQRSGVKRLGFPMVAPPRAAALTALTPRFRATLR